MSPHVQVRIWAALTMACCCPSAAFAEGDVRAPWYVIASYHQTGLDNGNLKFRQPSGNTNITGAFGDDTQPGLALGYAFTGPYRVDLEFIKHSNDLKVSKGNLLRSTSLETTTVVASVWRDIEFRRDWSAYIGAGVGVGTLKLSGLDANFYLGQLGAGLQWQFRPNFALDIGYRYQVAPSNPTLKGNGQELTTDYAANSVQIGMRFSFGGR